ncbi:hypothetical protein GCM10023065_08890 [Microbacterium laevaniformans]|uniref:sensor histidine kinase n=1 Tax=Microbacterium laevaniformans TaxID=36807 RepID=UPI001958D85D|nr:HAMP domain-containing sensor histidine kinase [Microbacterium laevaniformans]MBM7751839.1 two-component system OmpR family sensor kinase [Microbacterium laevaniformans]GLJ63805.1 hypothetical protein GCM10017578_06930 [Microbacterium laevaniformans]
MNTRVGVLVLAAAAVVSAGAAVAGVIGGDRRSIVVEAGVPAVGVGAAVLFAAAAAALALAAHRRSRLLETTRLTTRDTAASEHRRFLARLDHELKNPVTAIRVAVAASEADTPQLATIDAQTARLSRLVADLRKLSELQTSEVERSRVSVSALVTDVVDAVRDAHGREVAVTLPAAPWPLPDVVGDPDLLFVALFNVVANAAKYSEPSDVIEIRGDEKHGAVVLDVADTGRGIPADEIDAVFDELARGRNARDRAGSGLGLALVRTIVDRHGGEVTIASREGDGTRVRLALPAAG